MNDKSASSESEEISDELYSDLWNRRYDLLFKSWVQVRYHRRRQRFFDLVDKGTKAATLFLGASLFGKFLPSDVMPGTDIPIVGFVGTAISALGLMALVFGYGDRKQMHKELAEIAANLVASIEATPASQLSAEKVAKWAEDYARMCAKAPPPLKTLTIMCEHEQSAMEGHGELIPRPHFLRRVVSQVKA